LPSVRDLFAGALQDRLPDQSSSFLFAGVSGNLLLRPWFDRVARHLVVEWYLRLSRGWAAAVGSGGAYDKFRDEIGPVVDRISNIRSRLVAIHDLKRLEIDASNAWEEAFFGSGEPAPSTLLEKEFSRLDATNRLMSMRRLFLSVRRLLPAARWQVVPPEETYLKHMDRLSDPDAAFAAPDRMDVSESHSVPGPRGEERWIRMRSPKPQAGDWAWARVQTPRDGKVRGVLILLHGIFMEPEMWRALAAPAASLIDHGICLITPEAPWHGRRCPAGEYGGERILARGPLGFLDAFDAAVAETALWTRWARERFAAPVAVGGVSLGALTAQLVLSASRSWPDDARPDSGILVTTTRDMVATAFDGSLSAESGLRDRMKEVGWNRAELTKFAPLLQPLGEPGVDRERVVMVLGSVDTVTPFEGGRMLADQWQVPSANLFINRQGHFSASLGLCRDPEPLNRLREILLSSG
jgi:pimeloyl-ACP methyl ester carboxylesterase